jgi:hypothetical protein
MVGVRNRSNCYGECTLLDYWGSTLKGVSHSAPHEGELQRRRTQADSTHTHNSKQYTDGQHCWALRYNVPE